MFSVAVLESPGEGLSEELVRRGWCTLCPPESAELLVVSPNYRGPVPRVKRAVVPGGRFLPGALTVSYGLSRRDTVTASSIVDGRLVAALRRELVDMEGRLLSPGEAVVTPMLTVEAELALTAAGLLLGTLAV